jgi:phosphoserine phosphatase RsbU/P
MSGADVDDFEELFENAPCGYLLLRADGSIGMVNATFCEWTGHARSDVVGRRLRDMLSVASRMFHETHFAPLLRMQGFFDEVALDIVKRDGTKLLVLANAREKRDSKGDLVFTRITVFRATERRRYERNLVDARETADAQNRELSRGLDGERQTAELREQFIAVLGHDLRNPLAAIDAGVRLLLREKHNEKTANVLGLIQSTTRRMSALIDNVLDFARGRMGGGLSLKRERGRPLQPILDQVVAEIRATHPDRQIDVALDLDTADVEADHTRLAQLFSNLLGNAVTHGDPAMAIRVQGGIVDGTLELAVSNGGEPIPEAARDGLFLPFHRGKLKAHHQGLGLGLYIASQIAHAHGGRIDVTSDVKETRFTFRMPAG